MIHIVHVMSALHQKRVKSSANSSRVQDLNFARILVKTNSTQFTRVMAGLTQTESEETNVFLLKLTNEIYCYHTYWITDSMSGGAICQEKRLANPSGKHIEPTCHVLAIVVIVFSKIQYGCLIFETDWQRFQFWCEIFKLLKNKPCLQLKNFKKLQKY